MKYFTEHLHKRLPRGEKQDKIMMEINMRRSMKYLKEHFTKEAMGKRRKSMKFLTANFTIDT